MVKYNILLQSRKIMLMIIVYHHQIKIGFLFWVGGFDPKFFI